MTRLSIKIPQGATEQQLEAFASGLTRGQQYRMATQLLKQEGLGPTARTRAKRGEGGSIRAICTPCGGQPGFHRH
jgi:hypothetical protein